MEQRTTAGRRWRLGALVVLGLPGCALHPAQKLFELRTSCPATRTELTNLGDEEYRVTGCGE